MCIGDRIWDTAAHIKVILTGGRSGRAGRDARSNEGRRHGLLLLLEVRRSSYLCLPLKNASLCFTRALLFKLSGFVVRKGSKDLVELLLRLDSLRFAAELDPQRRPTRNVLTVLRAACTDLDGRC